MIRQYKKHWRIYIVHHALKRVSPKRRYIKYNTVPALAVAALPADKAVCFFVPKWLVAALPMPGYSFSDGHSVFKALFTDELSIQERLKNLRGERRLTLEQLAEQTHLSKSALGSYEAADFKDISK